MAFMELIPYLSFYKGKKVFITGHTGFKGTWLAYQLYQVGAVVRGFALENLNTQSIYHKLHLASKVDSIVGDIRDYEALKKTILDFEPDVIFHLAAQPLVIESYENPLYTYEVNVMGTAHVLESVRVLTKKCSVVIITTDKVYKNKEWEYPYRENDELGGYDPYSASKSCAEVLTASYVTSFFNLNKYVTHQKSVATARAGNVIGGGDFADNRIIPDIVNALLSGESIEVRNPEAVRPWQHVIEPVHGYMKLGFELYQNPEKYVGQWNFGPNADSILSVKEIVDYSAEVWGQILEMKGVMPIHHETQVLKLDISKANNKLKWFPVLNAKEAISWTINWYKSIMVDNRSAEEITLSQINNYIALL
jgi:CDP-glucose 4,6-dehydratase